MAKNKMADVAKLLNLELREEFKIQGLSLRYRVFNTGLQYYSETEDSWVTSNKLLPMLLQGEISIIKVEQPILDDIEKKYLGNIIKPFKDRVEWVRKFNSPKNKKLEYIKISYSDCTYSNVLNFPDFKRGTMYRGMKIGKSYTLKELGL